LVADHNQFPVAHLYATPSSESSSLVALMRRIARPVREDRDRIRDPGVVSVRGEHH
jgi:hypothetical protein